MLKIGYSKNIELQSHCCHPGNRNRKSVKFCIDSLAVSMNLPIFPVLQAVELLIPISLICKILNNSYSTYTLQISSFCLKALINYVRI